MEQNILELNNHIEQVQTSDLQNNVNDIYELELRDEESRMMVKQEVYAILVLVLCLGDRTCSTSTFLVHPF